MSKQQLLILRRIVIGLIIIGGVFVLSACSMEMTSIDETSTGFFNQYFIYPFSLLIKTFASWLQGSYGLAIVLITVCMRIVLMPFFVKQSKQSLVSQEKMNNIQPEMKAIQEKYKGKKSYEDQLNMQSELSALYKKHNFNPMSMATGCLPLVLQMPFLIAFYYAIRRTPEIMEQSFLWFHLGGIDIVLIMITIFMYAVQAAVMLMNVSKQQRKQMTLMTFVSPVMIGILAFNVPAALTLYWAISSVIMIVQSIFIKTFVQKQKVEGIKVQ